MAKKTEKPLTPIELLINDLNRKGVKVCRASETVDHTVLRRPSGIASVDYAMAGGAPSGTIFQVDGQEGVGKDAFVNCLVRMNQLVYGDDAGTLICYTEPSGYDKLWARKMGVQVALSEEEIDNYEKALGAKLGADMRTDLRRQVGNVLFCETTEAEDMFQKILTTARAGVVQLIILDSIDALLPEDYVCQKSKNNDPESEVSIEGGAGLPRAQIETEFINKYTNICHRLGGIERPTLVLIGQARANLAAARGPMAWMARKWESDRHGSHARRHLKTFNLGLQAIGKIPDKGEPKVGKRIKWDLTKAKRGSHDGQHGEYTLFFETGPDIVADLFDVLRSQGMLVQAGPRTRIIDQEGVVQLEGTGAGDVLGRLRTDPELWLNMYRMLMNTLPMPPILKP